MLILQSNGFLENPKRLKKKNRRQKENGDQQIVGSPCVGAHWIKAQPKSIWFEIKIADNRKNKSALQMLTKHFYRASSPTKQHEPHRLSVAPEE